MKKLSVLAAIVASLFMLGRVDTGKAEIPAIVPQRTVAFAPAQIAPLLERACHDCHSNRTTWPWYSAIPPVSSMIRRDVEKGRSKLDFSNWETSSGRPTRNEVQEICDAVSSGSMPPRSYRMMHRDAMLSSGEIELLCRWDNSAKVDPPQIQKR